MQGFDALFERMPCRLCPYGTQEDLADLLTWCPAAQGCAHVEFVVVEQAEVEAAVGSQSHAIAGSAVRRRNGADEPDHPTSAGQSVILRFVGCVGLGQSFEFAKR